MTRSAPGHLWHDPYSDTYWRCVYAHPLIYAKILRRIHLPPERRDRTRQGLVVDWFGASNGRRT